MKQKMSQRLDFVFFKRWRNKNYAVFNTLKKIVINLFLPLAYVASSFTYSNAQNDTLNLKGIIINSQRATIFSEQTAKLINVINLSQLKTIPASSISEILDGSLGIDFQNRGAMDVQSDISIRGGNFDQVLIMINGTPINDPQTGHNSFNIPLPVNIIERVEILEGPGTQIYGNGAYSGAINIVTKNNSHFSYISATYGSFGYSNLNFSFGSKKLVFGVGMRHSNGYTTNTDFSEKNIFFRYNFSGKNHNSFVQTSGNINDFGALDFYTPAFPNQYEKVWKLFTNIHSDLGKKQNHRLNLYWNVGYDNFQLFREGNDWYRNMNGYYIKDTADTAQFAKGIFYKGHNYHLSNTFGISYSTFFNSVLGKSAVGFNVEFDTILSNVLGYARDSVKINDNIIFNKGANRTIYNIFINQNKSFGNLTISAGTNYIYNQKFGSFWTFNGEMNYKFDSNNFTYVSISQGVRFPTFTDLFYQGASNEGNPNLKPERATNYEIGYKLFLNSFTLQTAVFYCIGTNTIDWVKLSANDIKWKTMNYTLLHTRGFQIAFTKNFKSRLFNSLSANYTYLYQNKPDTTAISKYSLNYLRHNFSLSTTHTIVKNLTLSLKVRYFLRNGSYFYLDSDNHNVMADFKSTFTADAKLNFNLKKLNLFIYVTNLLDKKYYDISYIKLPGRTIEGGLNISFR